MREKPFFQNGITHCREWHWKQLFKKSDRVEKVITERVPYCELEPLGVVWWKRNHLINISECTHMISVLVSNYGAYTWSEIKTISNEKSLTFPQGQGVMK